MKCPTCHVDMSIQDCTWLNTMVNGEPYDTAFCNRCANDIDSWGQELADA